MVALTHARACPVMRDAAGCKRVDLQHIPAIIVQKPEKERLLVYDEDSGNQKYRRRKNEQTRNR